MQEEKTPFQYSKYGNMIKSFLHTKIGAKVGYFLKIKRFNRVGAVHTCAKTGKQTFLLESFNAKIINRGTCKTH